ncbi:hypothetical protein Lmor_2486 [Legionella moravica]|uniref:Uncharacterized protein n=2 Tax=Legionella moravica TaxID=39962 RepID=A0A378JUH9_9GAMM|nr:hypothetical protein Lmor_2486 [Legionella moravica]STX62313.1 Uncharacterised protein [Legionella moravica]
MVILMFELFYNTALNAKSPEELSNNLYLISLDAIDPNPPFLSVAGKLAAKNKTRAVEHMRQCGANVHSIAAGFAIAGNDQFVDYYLNEFNADKNHIAYGYAFVGNHKKVDEYLTLHNASIHFVLQGFALANNHKKVNEYLANYRPNLMQKNVVYESAEEKKTQLEQRRSFYQSLLTCIAESYALTGNLSKVEEYQSRGASTDDIARAFALAGNHAKVEEYRVQYGADVFNIALGYKVMGRNTPSFYRALLALNTHGEAGKIVIDAMMRLKQGQDQFWNPYWMNSGEKLKEIIDAVETLPQDTSLSDAIKDEHSRIYKALNMHRITPLTFLGRLGFYHTKSVQTAGEEITKTLPSETMQQP